MTMSIPNKITHHMDDQVLSMAKKLSLFVAAWDAVSGVVLRQQHFARCCCFRYFRGRWSKSHELEYSKHGQVPLN